MKRTIKLTESDLHNIIKESVLKILKENEDNEPLVLHGDYTPEEKALMAKKEKKAAAAKKAAETRRLNKEKKRKEEEKIFMDKQKSMGYKELFDL